MNLMTRLLVIACLALPLAACKKEEAQSDQAAAPAAVAVPTSSEQKDWMPYLNYVLTPHMEGITSSPYAYFLPGEETEGFGGKYERQLEKLEEDLGRGIIAGNMLVFASPSSAKLAELVETAFRQVPAGSMKDVKVVFIGKPADGERARAAIEPAGVNYIFIEAK